MTDEATTTATEEADQASTTTEDQASTTTEASTEKKAEPAKDEKYLQQLREEAAETRTKLREAEKRAEDLENEKLSETERSKKEAEQARKRATALEGRVKRAEIREAAAGKEIANPDLAAELVDLSKVELDSDGKATNADALLESLVTRFPDLKAKEAPAEERTTELKKVLKDGNVVKGGDDKSQLSSTEGMTTEEISKALEDGRLRDYLASTK